MPGLVPGIHVFGNDTPSKTWMAGTSPAMTKIIWSICRFTAGPFVLGSCITDPTEKAMSTIAGTAAVSKPALLTGRVLSGLVIVFLLFDGAIKLVPWPIVTETMDRIGYGSSETLARTLGVITVACTVLYAIPPTSFVGAILLTGYLGGAMASHVRIGSPLFTHILFGFYLGLMVWGGLWLRDGSLRTLLPFRR
jgi:hypothetical protein